MEAVQSIALEDSRISLAPGGSAKLNWKILPSDPYTEALALEDLTFSSSNPSAVTLDEEGNAIARETISEDEYDPIPQAIYVGVTERE